MADIEQGRDFYERVVGLRLIERSDDTLVLGSTSSSPVVELEYEPNPTPRPPKSAGLFHLAILVPSRADLARALRRIADAGWSLAGASDHLVSEALYLRDPEGNGVEIYRDRPKEQWPYREGQLQMSTEPLDLQAVMAAMPGTTQDTGVGELTRMGHLHLRVSDLEAAESFYRGVLGFDVTVRSYPGALFVSAGGYHHHIGLNTWASLHGPKATAGLRGLMWFEVLLSDKQELKSLQQRIGDAGFDTQAHTSESFLATDPSGNRILLRT
jgi:catechol 2,3-dioxygenase